MGRHELLTAEQQAIAYTAYVRRLDIRRQIKQHNRSSKATQILGSERDQWPSTKELAHEFGVSEWCVWFSVQRFRERIGLEPHLRKPKQRKAKEPARDPVG